MIPRVDQLARQSPHRHVFLVEVRDAARIVRHENGVGRGFERGAHHGEGMRELFGLVLECAFRAHQLLLGAAPGQQNAFRILDRDRAQQLVFVLFLH